MRKTYKYYLLILVVSLLATSCKENSLVAEKNLPIESIDEFAGNWKGKAECTVDRRKLDTITVDMKFDGELLTINFNLYDSKSDGFPFPSKNYA